MTCLSTFLVELESNLLSSPDAFLGEVGLDAAFRIPLLAGGKNDPAVSKVEGESGDATTRRSNLSSLFTPLNHQIAIAKAQIDLAIKLKKKVSFHSVRSSKETLDLLARYKSDSRGEGFEKIHFCLHSFGGSAESARDVQRGEFCYYSSDYT